MTSGKLTITLTDRAPVTVAKDACGIIASAYDYDGQVESQSGRKWRITVRVLDACDVGEAFPGSKAYARVSAARAALSAFEAAHPEVLADDQGPQRGAPGRGVAVGLTAREKMRLATAAMGGDKRARAKLAAAGMRTETLAALYAIQTDAFAELSPAERAADYDRTVSDLDAIVAGKARA